MAEPTKTANAQMAMNGTTGAHTLAKSYLWGLDISGTLSESGGVGGVFAGTTSNMKTIILASLLMLGCISHATELGALYVVDARSSQTQETGVLRATELSLDSIRKKESKLGDYRKVTVIGSIARSGVYFSKAPIHLLDIIDLAGEIKEDNGAGSHRNVSVVIGDDIVTYDIRKLREMKEKGDQKYKVYLNGGEIVIRHHFSGL